MMGTPSRHPIPVVRLILQDTAGRILLLRRATNTMGGGQWCLPGGKVDYGETVHAAAARELLEETGLVWQAGDFLQYQDSLPLVTGDFHGINFYFVVKFDGTLSHNLESEDAQWFSPSLLPTLDIAFRNGEALAHFLHGGRQGMHSMKPGN